MVFTASSINGCPITETEKAKEEKNMPFIWKLKPQQAAEDRDLTT